MEREGFSIQKIAEHLDMNWRTAKRLLHLSEQDYLTEIERIQGRKRSLESYEELLKTN
jgi:DNA-directed RNA polymerase specialized sigma24 family protein